MPKKTKSIVLAVLVVAAVVLLGSIQMQAQSSSPCTSVRIYVDENGLERLKTTWDPSTCVLVGVFRCFNGSYDNGTCTSWVKQEPQAAYICEGKDDDGNYFNCSRTDALPDTSGLILKEWNVCSGGWCWG